MQIDDERGEMSLDATKHHEAALQTYAEIRKLEKQLKNLQNELQANKADKDQLDSEKQDLIRAKAKLEIDVTESKERHTKEVERVVYFQFCMFVLEFTLITEGFGRTIEGDREKN